GPGKPPPVSEFSLLLNPGAHVFTLSRKGYTDAVVNKTFAPGSRTQLALELSRLPATLRISSNVERALVRVGGVDIGPAPIDVLRPAGEYEVEVSRDGYDAYES